MSSHATLRFHLAALALLTLVTVGSRSGGAAPLAAAAPPPVPAAAAPPPVPAVGPVNAGILPAAPQAQTIRLPSCCGGLFATPPPLHHRYARTRPRGRRRTLLRTYRPRPPCPCRRTRHPRRRRCLTRRTTCPTYRPPNRPLLRKGGPYIGFTAGYLALPRAPGAYASLGSRVLLGSHYGWNIGPLFSLELGYVGGLFTPMGAQLSGLKQITLNGMTLDMKVRLLRPQRFTRVIPFLHTGLGVYWLSAKHKAESRCEQGKTFLMSQGGGVQVGGGLEVFLARWAVISAKVSYRPLFMSSMRGAPGGPSIEPGVATRRLHAVSAELGLTVLLMQ